MTFLPKKIHHFWITLFFCFLHIVGIISIYIYIYIYICVCVCVLYSHTVLAQLPGVTEYTDCISTEEQDSPNKCLVFDTKQSDGEVPVMLELWRMWSTPLLASLPGPLWHGVVAPDGVLFMDQIDVNCVLMLNWINWNRTVLTCKPRTYTKLSCLK